MYASTEECYGMVKNYVLRAGCLGDHADTPRIVKKEGGATSAFFGDVLNWDTRSAYLLQYASPGLRNRTETPVFALYWDWYANCL